MANSNKSHFSVIPHETKSIQIQNSCIKASSSEELIGTEIDSDLTFHDHNFVYSLRSGIELEKPSINIVQYRSEFKVYLGVKICELIPENIRSSELVDI